jgi:hypothetical protein
MRLPNPMVKSHPSGFATREGDRSREHRERIQRHIVVEGL